MDASWILTTADGPDTVIALPEIDLVLPLADLYAKVDFPPVAEKFEPDLIPPDSHPAGPRIR